MSVRISTTSGDRPLALVGRRRELNWLRTRLDLCARGYPQMVVVEGGSGIGKTRLAQELLAVAEGAGLRVMSGRSYERLELAYLPLRESLFSEVAAALADRPGNDEDVALLRSLDGERALAGLEPADPDDQQRTRQLLGLTRLVFEFTRGTPSVVFVDDLQWADPATIDLLRHLLFRFEGESVPLLLLATCRDETHGRAMEGVSALRREPRCATLHLGPLSELEAAELARDCGADNLAVARDVAITSDGNPLLVQELARQRHVDGGPRPAGPARVADPMRAAIDARLHALGPDARQVVHAVAFLVPYCTRPALASVSGLDGAALDAGLQEVAAQGILGGDGASLHFTHPLYAHAAYDETPELARRGIHRRIYDALLAQQSNGEPVSIRAVAHHLIAAGHEADPKLCADYARRAGDEAMALAAWSEAARYYEASLEAMDEQADPATAIAVHRLVGLCHRYDLDLASAVDHFDAAIRLCRSVGTDEMLADLYIWRLRCGVARHDLIDAVSDAEPIEALVATLEPTAPGLAAQGLVELAQLHLAKGRPEQAESVALDAITIAERAGDRLAFARAATVLSVPQWMRYGLAESAESLEQGLVQARDAGDESALVGPLFRLSLVLTWLGRFDEAEAMADESCALADRLNYPLELGLPLTALAQLAIARGDFDGAEHHIHQALLIQRLSGYDWAAGLYLPALVSACVARGRYQSAHDALDVWAETASRIERSAITLFRAYVDALDAHLAPDDEPLPKLPRTLVVGTDAWAVAVVEVACSGGSAVDVRTAHDLLAEADARGGVLTSSLVALVPRVLGVAADLLGDEAEAIAALERAIAVGRRLGAEPERARAGVNLATILLRNGERDRARGLLEDAFATFDRLGMQPDIDRANTLLGTRATRLSPSSSPPGDGRARAVSTRWVILFTDVVDSTRLTEQLGDARYRESARQLEDFVLSAIAVHGGRVVSGINLGDGFIGLFRSVERALAAGRACARDAGTTGLHLHVAVHSGDLIVDGPRIYGRAVNLAARICAITGPDEVLVSDVVRDLTTTMTGVEFVDRGEHAFKGIAEPKRVYALVDSGQPS